MNDKIYTRYMIAVFNDDDSFAYCTEENGETIMTGDIKVARTRLSEIRNDYAPDAVILKETRQVVE